MVDIYNYSIHGDYNGLYMVYKPTYNYIKYIDIIIPHYNHNNGRVV